MNAADDAEPLMFGCRMGVYEHLWGLSALDVNHFEQSDSPIKCMNRMVLIPKLAYQGLYNYSLYSLLSPSN